MKRLVEETSDGARQKAPKPVQAVQSLRSVQDVRSKTDQDGELTRFGDSQNVKCLITAPDGTLKRNF